MGDVRAVCHACGGPKDLPLGRCPTCALLPAGEAREDALLCSSLFLDDAALDALADRIRQGEPLRPTPQLRRLARERLLVAPIPPASLTSGQMAALAAANLLLTPLVGWAVWLRFRTRTGPGATQALVVTAPTSIALGAAIVAWRWYAATAAR